MSVIDKGRAVLRLQYQATCLPLRLFERQTRRLGTDSPVHLLAERVVATLDRGVGQLLGDSELRHQGDRGSRHVDALTRATRLEQDAWLRRVEADELAEQAAERAGDRREQADNRQNERVSSAVREKLTSQRETDERARDDVRSAEKAADNKAQQRIQAAHTEQETKEKESAARVQRATEEPRQELKEAAEQRQAAVEKRDDAKALDKLAAHERAERRGTANGSA